MSRFIIFFFPVLFFCVVTVFGFTESDILFLRGLSDRNLFESVEIFCNEEFQNPNVSTVQKTILATELVRSRTQQLLLEEPAQRSELWQQLHELETQFLGSHDEWTQPEFSLARISLQLQFAVAKYTLGDWQRLEAEVTSGTSRDNALQQTRTMLLYSLECFQRCTEQLEKLRQKIGLNTDSSFERRFLILLRSIGYQAGLAQMSLALSFPAGDDRIFSLNRAVIFLTELASLSIDDPIIFRSRIELATCHRLLGDYDKCKELLSRLQDMKLPTELRFQTEAELIRYWLVVGNIDEAVGKIKEDSPDSSVYPDYELAKLEILLVLSRRFQDKTEQQTEINRMILEQTRRIDQQFGIYWGRRARMFLGNSHLTVTEGIDAPLLKMLAEDQFQNGQFTEAVRFFELASRRAEMSGNKEETFNNAVSAIAVLSEVLKRLETVTVSHTEQPTNTKTEITLCRRQIIDSLRNISLRFPENPDVIELHLKAIDLAAQVVLEKEMSLDDYLALLKEHAEYWTNSPKIAPLLFRAAVLQESRGQMLNALSMLEKISNHSAIGLDTVNTAKRCFNALTESESPVSVAEWFERRLPVDGGAGTWNEADVVSVMYAVEQRIQSFARAANKTEVAEISKKSEQLLRHALQYCPDLKPITKIQLQAMLVTVLNDLERKEEGAAILRDLNSQQLAILPDAEKRDFLRVQIQLLADTGKVQDAVDLLKKQLKQNPDDLPFLILLAEILTRQNDFGTQTKAIELWTRIANQSVKNTETWWLSRERMIELYYRQNKIIEVKKEFELLRLLYPELGGAARKSRLETLFNALQNN
jgi:tetratricopeptide (TPR) repeat protein